MKTGVTVGILAVLLIAAVAISLFYFSGSQSQGTQENLGGDSGNSLLIPTPGSEGVEEMIVNSEGETGNQVFIVEITSSGFSPQTLEISQGDTVTWTNQNSASSWPASAIHPTHTLYPGFDSKRGLKNGESYSFTFDKVGTWGYHDHLSPSTKGTIVVE